MAAVLNSMDSHLFELRNFKANELMFRERHSNKLKPARGSSPGRMSPSPRRGMNGESQVKGARNGMMVESQVKLAGGNPPASTTAMPAVYVESQAKATGGQLPSPTTALALHVQPRVSDNGVRTLATTQEDNPKKTRTTSVQHSLDDATLQKLAKMVVQEMQEEKKVPFAIRLDDFTGERSPYLAEDAMVWLKKLTLAARRNEWDYTEALEVASVHLKGLAARWFASIEKHLNQELHLDKDRWNYFQSQFEERFADFRSRLFQIEKIKGLRMSDGEDVREYAEAIMSMNTRLDEPLDDEFLRWVFIQGLPPSDLKDKLVKFEEKPTTFASAVKYARRFQLSQSVFNLKDLTPRSSPASNPSRSIRSN